MASSIAPATSLDVVVRLLSQQMFACDGLASVSFEHPCSRCVQLTIQKAADTMLEATPQFFRVPLRYAHVGEMIGVECEGGY